MSPAEAGERLRAAKRVLLVKPHHKLGDLLVATPVIRNLRRALTDAELVFVAGRYNAPAVLDNPDLDEVIVAPVKGPAALVRGAGLVRGLRRRRFDVALLLSSISHSGSAVALARLARPGFTAGLDDAPYGSRFARDGYDCVLEPPDDLKCHIVDYNLTLLERLGIPVEYREHVLGVTESQLAAADAVLRDAGLDGDGPLLGIQAGGNLRHPNRLWPPASYAVIAQRARAELGYRVVLLGRRADRPAADEVRRLGHVETPMLLGLPFAVYKAVLRRLGFFITHDGGPVHVAAGVGVPSFFVFLWTSPRRWAPYGAHVGVWEDHTRVPTANEVWDRVRSKLVTAAGAGTPV
jgi:ADP-heptose:LPS heptosyltransferase